MRDIGDTGISTSIAPFTNTSMLQAHKRQWVAARKALGVSESKHTVTSSHIELTVSVQVVPL